MTDYSELYNRIGYTFSNPQYLSHALQRTAFAREQNISLNETMDYLAVLGDAVIEIVTIQSIIDSGVTDKGEITRQKTMKVNMSVLRTLAEEIDLPDFVRWGKGEITMQIWTVGRASAECFEALIGAVYSDGGIPAARLVLENLGFI